MTEQVFTKDDVGKRAWDFTYGWGEIIEFKEEGSSATILVDFVNGEMCSYRLNGKVTKNDINPSLFWDEIKIEIPPRPKEKKMKRFWLWSYETDNGWVKSKNYFCEKGIATKKHLSIYDWDESKKIKHENEFIDIEVEG